MTPLLRKLYENALKDSSNSRGNHHNATILKFAAALYCLIGKSGYELLCCNLGFALPSISTVQRLISKQKKLYEGEFDFDELAKHYGCKYSPR